MTDTRLFQNTLVALAKVPGASDEGTGITLCAPTVGLWRDAPAPGSLVTPGARIGAIEMLGVVHALVAPPGAYGISSFADEFATDGTSADVIAWRALSRRPVAYGTRLLTLDLEGISAAGALAGTRATSDGVEVDGSHVFRAPMSGRFYRRPSPDKPPFVEPGDTIRVGSTVCLLEVMKTFNRMTYGGDGLPETAVVKEVVPEDQVDLSVGDIILRLA